MENNKSLKLIIALRKGEKVKCPKCNKGVLKSNTEPSKSHFFFCTQCENTVNID